MKKVLIIRSGSLGDLILTLPVVQNFKKDGFEVFMAGQGLYRNFFEKYSDVNNFVPFDSSLFLPLFSGEKDNFLSDFLNEFDLIIFYDNKDTIQSRAIKKLFKGEILFWPVDKDELKIHIIDHLLIPVEKIVNITERIPVLKIKKAEEILLVIHPGSGGKNKNYSREKFYRVLKKSKYEKFKLILGPAEFDQYNWWKEKVGEEKILKTDSLDEIVEIVKTTDIYIGNDSGITHLFAASSTRTVAIFGPTSPLIWGPRGERVKIIFKKVGCNPCNGEKMKNCKSRICFDRVSIEDIIKTIEDFKNGKTGNF